jgi:hypothetical protein
MAINACSINGFTLHGRRCTDKFAILVPILHPTVPPVTYGVGGNPRVLRDTFVPPRELEDRLTLNFEQPFITVTVDHDGDIQSQTLEATQQLDFVTVTNLQIFAAPSVGIEDLVVNLRPSDMTEEVSVNISDLEF